MNTHKTQLKICTFNTNTLTDQKGELTAFLKQDKIDIILIQETRLKPHNTFKIPNYTTHRTDRTQNNGGGTAIIIRNTIKHTRIPNIELENFESTIITLHNPNITIISCYKTPQKSFCTEQFTQLLNTGQRLIIGGDLNAKHTTWRSQNTNTSGRTLHKLTQKQNLTITAPYGPTRIAANSEDVLDIFITKNLKSPLECKAIHALNSDHLPVTAILDIKIKLDSPHITHTTYDWKKFRKLTHDYLHDTKTPTTPQELDHSFTNWENTINKALEASQIKTNINTNRQCTINTSTLNKIKHKNRLRKDYQRYRDPHTKQQINTLQKEIKHEIHEANTTQWKQYIDKIYERTKPHKIYIIPKQLTNKRRPLPAFKVGTDVITDNEQKTEIIAHNLTQQFTPNTIPNKSIHESINTIYTHIDTLHSDKTQQVDENQILRLIKDLPNKKAPGPDNIPNRAYKNLPPKATKYLTTLIQQTFQTNHFPTPLKTAKIIPVPKPNKILSNPNNYRPISLLNTSAKLIEKIITTEINNHMDERNLYNPNQYGFRKGLSTTHALHNLTEYITQGLHKQHSTVGVFLDIQRAFDKIDHKVIISKLLLYQIDHNLIKLIKSYLENRNFFVYIENAKSSLHNIQSGVPQGSILGPLLFIISINDMPQPRSPNKVLIYADDTAIFSQSPFLNLAIRHTQTHLNTLVKYFTDWGLTLNTDKTDAIIFAKRRKKYKHKLTIHNTQLPFSKDVTYLGVRLDKRLTYKRHIQDKLNTAKHIRSKLYNLMKYVNTHEAIKLYKIYIRPHFEYATPGLTDLTTHRTRKWETYQNKLLRHLIGNPRYARNTDIRKALDMYTLETRRDTQHSKFINKLTNITHT